MHACMHGIEDCKIVSLLSRCLQMSYRNSIGIQLRKKSVMLVILK